MPLILLIIILLIDTGILVAQLVTGNKSGETGEDGENGENEGGDE